MGEPTRASKCVKNPRVQYGLSFSMQALSCSFNSCSWHIPNNINLSIRPVAYLFRPKNSRFRLQKEHSYCLTMAASDSNNTSSNSSLSVQSHIIVTNESGEKLAGIFHDTGSREVVVLCHGFRSRKDNAIMVNLANGLLKKGISAFRFDFSGNGESEGQFQYGNYWKEVEDLRSVVLHLSEKGRPVVAIVGHSKGGDIVLLYASKYHDIGTVINISGRFDLKNGIKERLGEDFMEQINEVGFIDVHDKFGDGSYRVTKESLMDRLQTDMISAAHSISNNCRVLTIHGSDDEVIPISDALEFDKIIPCHTLQIIEGANHRYTSHLNELVPFVLNFVKIDSQS